jgi:tRNA threonylcarbamoyladenosine biosynthesis protein TsaB
MAAAAPLLIAGDAAASAAEALRGRIDFDLIPDSAPDAVGVVAAALSAGRAGLAARPARPFYLRPPDVTLPKPQPSFATGLR